MADPLLLDTHAAIWLMEAQPMREESRQAIRDAVATGTGVRVSPISAWEAALLVKKRGLRLATPPLQWFETLCRLPGFRSSELRADILVASVDLPGSPPNDPADRILIATARIDALVLVTRDAKILDYAAQGFVRALAC